MDECVAKNREEYEHQKSLKTNFDALLFEPRDLEGRQVDLDAEAFEVIDAWATLPASLKAAIVAIVRSQGGPRPIKDQSDAEGGAQ